MKIPHEVFFGEKWKKMDFKLVSDYKPTGDQQQTIAKPVEGIKCGEKMQTLLGVAPVSVRVLRIP